MTDSYIVTMINCPFHDDKTPSCAIYSNGRYHCFGAKCTKPNGKVEDIPKDKFSFAENKVAENSKSRYVIVDRGKQVKVANLENYKLIDSTRTEFWMKRNLHTEAGGGLQVLRDNGVLMNMAQDYCYWFPTYDMFKVNTGGCLRTVNNKVLPKVKLCGHPVYGYPKYSYKRLREPENPITKELIIVESMVDMYVLALFLKQHETTQHIPCTIDCFVLLGTEATEVKRLSIRMLHDMHNYSAITVAFDKDAEIKSTKIRLELAPLITDTRLYSFYTDAEFYMKGNVDSLARVLGYENT